MRLFGVPYDSKTLEPLDESDDSDSDNSKGDSDDSDNSESNSYNNNRSKLKEREVIYNVGRFCQKRGQIYHELHHYRFHLYHAIAIELTQLGWSPKRLARLKTNHSKIAEKLVQEMEQDGATTKVNKYNSLSIYGS